MLIITISISILFIVLDLLHMLLNHTESHSITTPSMNFECGMNPIIRTIARFKEDYWIIMSIILIFEQELLLIMLIVFGFRSFNHYYLVITILLLLFIELLIIR